MKILLMTPTRVISRATFRQIEKVFTVSEPMGLAYLSGMLRKHNYDVEVLDALAENFDFKELERFFSSRQYDLIGINVDTPSVPTVIKNIEIIKRLLPDCKIIIGGPHVNALHNSVQDKKVLAEIGLADAAVYGEGEVTLLEIVEAVKAGRSFAGINGVIWKDDSSEIYANPPRKLIENIDEIPFPALELFPLRKYRRTPSSYRRTPVRSVFTSRGCPFSCVFCDRGGFGKVVRKRSIENIMAEIDILVKKFGAKEIRFWDDVFTLNEERVIRLCEQLKRYNLLWSCNGRVNMLTKPMLKAMKEAGCWEIDLGIESGNDRVLEIINKRFNTEQARKTIRLIKEARIEVRTFFILGLPGETTETVWDSINFALNEDIDYATFYLPQAYPGTKLYEIARSENSLGTEDYSDYLIAGQIPSYVNKNIGLEKLMRLQRTAYRKFYKRAGYIFRKLCEIRTMEDIKRYYRSVSILWI